MNISEAALQGEFEVVCGPVLKEKTIPVMPKPRLEKTSITQPKLPAIGLLVLVNLIAASFLYSPGTEDVETLHRWTAEITAYGLRGGFAHSLADYPPLTFVFLAAVAQLASALGLGWFIVLKSSVFLFLAAMTAAFYWFTRNLLLTAGFESTLVLNSVALGYIDVYSGLFVIAALFLLQRGYLTLALVLFTTSCFIKWQPLILAPFIGVYVVAIARDGPSNGGKVSRIIAPFAASGIIVVIPVFLFFGANVLEAFDRIISYRYISGNALNLGWIFTWALHVIQPDAYGSLNAGQIDLIIAPETLPTWPAKILFYAVYAIIFVVFARQKKTFERLVTYSMLCYLAYFIFNTGVHENHLFLVPCFAWILVFLNPDYLTRCLNLSIAANANLFLFYGVFGQPLPFPRVIAGVDITLWFALANVALFFDLLLRHFKAEGIGARFWLAPGNAQGPRR